MQEPERKPQLGPEVSRRVDTILDAVEDQVGAVRRDAEEEAHRRMEGARRRAGELLAERERRLSELTDALIARAAAALEGLYALRLGEPPGAPGEAQAPPPHVEDPEHPQREGPDPEVARLVAIQMAATGCTRDQVEDHLRGSLGLEAPGPILDDVFGPASPGHARVPWAKRTGE